MRLTIDLIQDFDDPSRIFNSSHDPDLSVLTSHIMSFDYYKRSSGLHNDLNDQLRMLAREFFGKPALLYYNAGLTVHIRRKIDMAINAPRFFHLWHRQGDQLLEQLDSRWLVSACDTIMDISEDPNERALALAGSLFTNTIKLYETERMITGQADVPYAPLTEPKPLVDGLTTFMVGGGDMVANLIRRSRGAFPDHLLTPRILRELITRACRHDTVYKRFALVHKNDATRWSRTGESFLTMPQIPPSFTEMAWLFSCDNRNRGIIRQNFDEAALLWQSVQATRGPILEIGRARGGSTALLVTAGAGRPVTSIDVRPNHHAACDKFFAEILAAEPERLRLLIEDSRKPLDGAQFGLIFIDGDHSYEGVRGDVIAHWPSLKPVDGTPALAVFHDAVPNEGLRYDNKDNHCEGVRRICEELVNAGCARIVKSAGSSLSLEKIGELPWEWTLGQADGAANLHRRDDVILRVRPGGIGVELGVAEGFLSERLLKRNRLSHLYSIDMYSGDRGHDTEQYKRAIHRLMPYRHSNTLLKLRFDEALSLFDDGYFDFIYIDGYAHTNEDEGKTLHDWWPKLKTGGIFAGDDYCAEKWPGVVKVVNDFTAQHGLSLHVIDSREDQDYCRYPTWYTHKP